MRDALQQTMGNFFPFGMEEMGRQNMAMLERAMSLFTPFYRPPQQAPETSAPAEAPARAELEEEIAGLRAEVDRLRTELQEARRSTAETEAPPVRAARAKPATG
jgi:polyhydroxyalkanoate synthesis regulator protein